MELEQNIERWWPKLPEASRDWILEHQDEPLSATVLTSLIRTRGYGPASAYFVDGDASEKASFYLTDEELTWIALNGRSVV